MIEHKIFRQRVNQRVERVSPEQPNPAHDVSIHWLIETYGAWITRAVLHRIIFVHVLIHLKELKRDAVKDDPCHRICPVGDIIECANVELVAEYG